ncbi:Histidine kinase group protein, partial [Pleurostoma richardsiae]
MAKKKNRQQLASQDDGDPNDSSVSLTSFPKPPSVALEKTSSTSTSKTKPASQPPPSSPALIICRNKHWRYISSFHGPWLQLPPDILETLANINYNSPRPRPVDPSVFFDLVKIRRNVDEATNLSVRAASGVASPVLSNSFGGGGPLGHAAALGLGFGGGGGHMKLSKERRHRMREQATQKLSRAYRLDEIACSVATMQSASSLEEVASLVLQRNPADSDAKYVHFFHEKIPSRQLAESTSLDPLSEIIAARPTDGEPLRTRATVRVFKADFEGAAADLTSALQVMRLYRPHTNKAQGTSQEPQQQLQHYEKRSRRQEVVLDEEQQPTGLEIQLLFQRAGVYLTIACKHVSDALFDVGSLNGGADEHATGGDASTADDDATEDTTEATTPPGPTAAEKETLSYALEARKIVKTNAKKALRDYMAYISHFDYSPDLPVDIPEDFTRRVSAVANHTRGSHRGQHHGRSDSPASDVSYRVYSLSELFSATPPPGLPPYPSTELAAPKSSRAPGTAAGEADAPATTEMVTYHPLLTDALHALLLCHALVQTSAKELLRHAYMVARLARLTDGYPVFQSSRSPARADWIEIIRRCDNWIQLVGSWESLCAPAPLPLLGQQQQQQQQQPPAHNSNARQPPTPKSSNLPAITASDAADASSAPQDGAAINSTTTLATRPKPAAAAASDAELSAALRNRVILEALEDERVHDEASLRASILARQRRAEEDLRLQQQQQQQQQQQEAAPDNNDNSTSLAVAAEKSDSSTPTTSSPAVAPADKEQERKQTPAAAAAPRRWA